MEKNLAQFSETYSQGLWIVSFIFLSLGLLRLMYVLRNKQSRNWLIRVKLDWFIIALKVLFFIGLLVFLADIPVWFFAVAQFRPVAPNIPYVLFIFVMYYITIQELILSLTVSESLITGFVKRIVFFMVSIFCSFSFILAGFIVPGTYIYPHDNECELLELPIKGEWLTMHGGKEKWVNYHSNYPPQQYAIDMVKTDENGRFFRNGGEDSTDFFSFGDSIFAPANGVIYNLADGFNTQMIYKGTDTVNVAGNFIEIKLRNEKFLFLAHLRKGSLIVKIGDSVQAGQYIANSGNSGNTSFPHLHMHIQDKPILNDSLSVGLPFRFKTMERKRFITWSRLENSWLMRNDRFRN